MPNNSGCEGLIDVCLNQLKIELVAMYIKTYIETFLVEISGRLDGIAILLRCAPQLEDFRYFDPLC